MENMNNAAVERREDACVSDADHEAYIQGEKNLQTQTIATSKGHHWSAFICTLLLEIYCFYSSSS
jgi:hypothetical protein